MYDGALVDGVIRIYHLGGGETEEGVDGDKNHTDGVVMNRASPLKVVVSSY